MPREVEVKSVLNKTRQRDPWFLDDYTLNLYSSCSFNCLYCYIRGSKYGINLEESLTVKKNAIELLDKQLAGRAKKNQFGFIVLSSVTDPYLPVDKKYQLTRQALSVIAKHRFPVHIITKSGLIERDFDLLEQIDKTAIIPSNLEHLKRGALISFSFSTIDDTIAKIFEPGAPAPSLRLEALNKTIRHNFFAGVSLMPLLPYITDTGEHLELLFSTFRNARVKYLLPATISLHGNGDMDSKTLMLHAIRKYYPELESKYLKFFETSDQMPGYYKRAFYNKMKELGKQFGLPDSILDAAHEKI